MTWTSHSLANGALVLAATGRIDMTLAAIATATLPDQVEKVVPWVRHRGVSHWLAVWIVVLLYAPVYVQRALVHHWPPVLRGWGKWHGPHLIMGAGAIISGLALGPLLHVLLDGCSSRGVPLLPFLRARLRLRLYQTGSARSGHWNPSELFFLLCLLGGCAMVWHARWR